MLEQLIELSRRVRAELDTIKRDVKNAKLSKQLSQQARQAQLTDAYAETCRRWMCQYNDAINEVFDHTGSVCLFLGNVFFALRLEFLILKKTTDGVRFDLIDIWGPSCTVTGDSSHACKIERKIDLDAIIYIEQMLPRLTDKWFEKAIEKELKRLIRKCERGTKKLRKELKQYQTKKDTNNG